MTRAEILKELKKYFSLSEMFCPHIVSKFGELAWQFPDIRLLAVLLWLRTSLNKAIYINNGKNLTQRGMRCNLCKIVKDMAVAYLSSHILGSGIDFTVEGMTPDEVRNWIVAHQAELPFNIRLERSKTWVHLDVRNETDEKIVWFNP